MNEIKMAPEIDLISMDNFASIDPDQLVESSGVRIVSPEESKALFYHPSACIPIDEWHCITDEIRHIDQVSDRDALSKVGLFNLSDEIKDNISTVIAKYDRFPPRTVQLSRPIEELIDVVKNYVIRRFNAGAEIKEFGGIGFNSPRLDTVTVSRQFGQRMGLHYDSWYGASIRSRLHVRHRIAVNFGPVPRWFLFVPIQLRSFVKVLNTLQPALTSDDSAIVGSVGDCLKCMQSKARCLKLNPGQGYIAATEALIHDATSRWTDRTSYNFQLMSEFDWLSQRVVESVA